MTRKQSLQQFVKNRKEERKAEREIANEASSSVDELSDDMCRCIVEALVAKYAVVMWNKGRMWQKNRTIKKVVASVLSRKAK